MGIQNGTFVRTDARPNLDTGLYSPHDIGAVGKLDPASLPLRHVGNGE